MMPATLSIITNAFPAAGARQGDRHLGRRAAPWRWRSARWSAASSSRTSPGSRSSSSTSRSPSIAVVVTLCGDARVARRDRRRARSTSPASPRSPSASPRSSSRSSRATRGAGARRGSSACSSSRSSASIGVRRRRAAASRAPMVDFALLPLALVPGRQPRRLHRQLRDARDVLLPRALHAEHPRLLARSRPACASCPRRVVIIVVGPIAGRLADRIGPRPLMIAGLLIVAASLFWQSFLDVDTSYGYLRRRLHADGPRHGPRDVADEHRRDERRRPDEGRRRLAACCR